MNIEIRPKDLLIVSERLFTLLIFLVWSFFISAFYLGFISANTDYEQGEIYRLLFIHVPSAWISLLIYTLLFITSVLYMINYHPIYIISTTILSKIGFCFTTVTLFTGCIWGLNTWGVFWVWDARLTSFFVLFLFYIVLLIIPKVIPFSLRQGKTLSIVSIIGFLNIPLVKFSVDWWNTLHQSSSVTQFGTTLHISVLFPVLLFTISLLVFSLVIFLSLLRSELNYKKINFK